jgi:hypothetical protein
VKLRVDVRRFLAAGAADESATTTAEGPSGKDVDLRRLPWADAEFSALELDDVPDPAAWAHSGPALNECRRVLKRNGLLELRTRRKDAAAHSASQKAVMGELVRLLQNHGFDVVAIDSVDDGGPMISALALRSDGPEDRFADAVAAPESHLTLHGPLFNPGDECAANRALAVSLDECGVKVRVRVIFDVADACSFD